MRIIAPTLFKMIGRGFEDDAYAHDGIHLRWFVAPTIGFPRAPFQLWIREGIDRNQDVERRSRQDFNKDTITAARKDEGLLEFAGISVYRELPHKVVADTSPTGGILIAKQPLYIDFRSGPGPHGVSYAEVTLRLQSNGVVAVQAQHRGPDGWYVVDHKMTRRTPFPPIGPVTLRLRGDRIFRLALTGERASVTRVRWIPADSHANETHWDHIADFFLPVADPADDWYPNWTTNPIDIAMDRLVRHPAKAHDPWITREIPPPPGDPPKEDHYKRCYAEPYITQFDKILQDLLMESRAASIPQLEVVHQVPLEPPQNPGGGPSNEFLEGEQHLNYRPLLMLLMALYDVHFARFMGLATVQKPPDPSLSWDYMVTARWHEDELDRAIVPRLRPFFSDGVFLELASIVPALRIGARELPARPSNLQAILDQQTAPGSGAVAHTRLSWRMPQRERPFDPESIGLLYALVRKGPEGEVSLNALNPITECRIPFLPDDHRESEIPEEDLDAGIAVFRDRTVPAEGDYTYRVSGSDPFGRWSQWAEVNWTFVDTVAPNAPVNLRAIVIDPADPAVPGEAKTWAADKPNSSIRVWFDWPDELAAMAPDLAFFRLHVRQGIVSPAIPDFQSLGRWGHLQYSDVSSTFALRFDPSGGNVTIHPDPAPLQPVRVYPPQSYVEEAGGGVTFRGTRYTVDLSGFTIPLGANGQGRVSVAVSALDTRGNESNPVTGPVPAILSDRTPPDPVSLPPLDKATYADATGRSTYELRWDGQPGVRYAVWRGMQTKLIDVASPGQLDGFNSAETMAEKGQRLREIAADNFDALVRVNQELVPAKGDAPGGPLSYADELPGYSRNLHVYAVVGVSRTGIDGARPANVEAFTAVEIPQRQTPSPPLWSRLRATATGVELVLKLDRSVPTGAVEIYRTVNQQRAEDVRQMLPIARIQGVDLPADLGGEEPVTLTTSDDNVKPWRRYYYRAVARALPDDTGVLGARSVPSSVGTVLTFDPSPPMVVAGLAVDEVDPAGRTVRLSWTSTVPLGPVAQGTFKFAIWRKGIDERNFVEIVRLATNEKSGIFSAKPPPSTPPGTEVEITYSYRDELPEELAKKEVGYYVRVIDPLGQFTNSGIVVFTPTP